MICRDTFDLAKSIDRPFPPLPGGIWTGLAGSAPGGWDDTLHVCALSAIFFITTKIWFEPLSQVRSTWETYNCKIAHTPHKRNVIWKVICDDVCGVLNSECISRGRVMFMKTSCYASWCVYVNVSVFGLYMLSFLLWFWKINRVGWGQKQRAKVTSC